MTRPTSDRGFDLIAFMEVADSAPPFAIRESVAAAFPGLLTVGDVDLLVADLQNTCLTRFGVASSEPVALEGNAAGRTFREQEVQAVEGAAATVVYVPVTLRAERLGVLRLAFDRRRPLPSPAAVAEFGRVLAYVIAANRRYTDVFDRARRRQDVSLAAELQWNLLPALVFGTSMFQLAGWLEPAYDIGGDSFDYELDGTRLSVVSFDAMGRGVSAALTSTLAVAACRNARREGRPLLEQFVDANRALRDEFGASRFVTALGFELDIETGVGVAVNAGHPPFYRSGPEGMCEAALDPQLPLGVDDEPGYRAQLLRVSPGERLVMVSDGVTDARPSCGTGDPYGPTRLTDLLGEALTATPTDVVRHGTAAVVEHHGGALSDDVTIVCLDWLPHPDGPRGVQGLRRG